MLARHSWSLINIICNWRTQTFFPVITGWLCRDNKIINLWSWDTRGEADVKVAVKFFHLSLKPVVPAAPCVPENAIQAFGNGSDVKTGASQPGMPSPATDNQSPHLATTAPGVSMETEQNILRAQIPTQVRRDGRMRMWCTTFSKQRGTNGDGRTQNWVALLLITRGVCFIWRESSRRVGFTLSA